MAYNGSGTFLINTAGQPVVAGTVISSTAFNALTADLATGLSTVITKDGQTTVTANIPMATFKFTGLGVGSAAGDSANLSQVQSTVTKLLASVSGADTVTATASPTLAAYAAGQMFYFVAAGDNTTSVTLNIDALGAKDVTRDGSVALAAADIKSGEVVVVVYDGTRFQVVSQLNSAGNATFANVSITSALNVGGVATFSGNVGIGTASPGQKLEVAGGTSVALRISATGNAASGLQMGFAGSAVDTFLSNTEAGNLIFGTSNTERARIDPSGNLGLGVTPSNALNTTKSFEMAYSGAVYGKTNTNETGIVNNYYQNSGGTVLYKNNGYAASYVLGDSGNHAWYIAASGTAGGTVSLTQAMTLTAAGELLLGASSQFNSGKQCIAFSGTAYYGISLKDTVDQTNARFIGFINGSGTVIGSIDRVTTTNAVVYNTTSDYRLKTVLGAVANAGQRIDALEPVEYTWNDNGERARGFLAHQFQEVYASSVTGIKDAVDADGKPVYQAMQASTSEVIADLVAELQSLRKRVAELESK